MFFAYELGKITVTLTQAATRLEILEAEFLQKKWSSDSHTKFFSTVTVRTWSLLVLICKELENSVACM